jgi:hypothetical protein
MNKPPEIWTAERLQEAAISELLKHGGSESDVRQLLQHFKAAEPESQQPTAEIPE